MSQVNPELEAQILQVIRENPAILVETIEKYQRETALAAEGQIQTLAQSLKTEPQKFSGEAPSIGARDGRYTLAAFLDFSDPAAAASYRVIQEFIEKHQDEVTLLFFCHPSVLRSSEGHAAAKAAFSSHEQGKFWAFADGLFDNQAQLGDNFYNELAQTLNLDLEQFEYSLRRAESTVAASVAVGQPLAHKGPTVLLNGAYRSNPFTLEGLETLL